MGIRPWLWLPAHISHDLAPFALELGSLLTAAVDDQERTVKPFTWTRKGREIHFVNPLGVAGGVDKDGRQIAGWKHFGAGFMEVGTITPRPQKPNPGKIMSRLASQEALWNRMGFPSPGAFKTRSYLREFRLQESVTQIDGQRRFPIFANIGKQRETSLERAAEDYLELIDIFTSESAQVAGRCPVDGFVINISSPNTTGLRELFQSTKLVSFLSPIAEKLREQRLPGLLKLSPDMDEDSHISALATVSQLDLDGVVVTNTTSSRPMGLELPKDGGLSGRPLLNLSREFLKKTVKHFPRGANTLGSQKQLIISVGGVLDGHEARWRLLNGADLVETYSGLVFSGPGFFRQSLKNLA